MSLASTLSFWYFISRFGESEIVLPVAAGLSLALIFSKAYRASLLWAASLCGAALLTAATKIAFMGWGIGWATVDFTGLSGHSVLSAAIYPVLAHMLSQRAARPARHWAVGLAYALAALVAVSRVVIHAHSVSEACSGFFVGAFVSAWGIYLLSKSGQAVSNWIFVGIAAWLTVMPVQARPSGTHTAITRLALVLSHRAQPYQRADLLRRLSPHKTSLNACKDQNKQGVSCGQKRGPSSPRHG